MITETGTSSAWIQSADRIRPFGLADADPDLSRWLLFSLLGDSSSFKNVISISTIAPKKKKNQLRLGSALGN